jgi:hypothetical protein
MSTFSAKGTDIDVETIMSDIRKKIGEKRKGLYTEEEVKEIAEMKLDAVLDASEFNSDFVTAFRDRDAQWNFSFGPETIYASSRGVSGSIIRWARKLLNPVLKLFFNPNPVISSLSRQSDLNRYYAQLLHNMALEMTKMNLEMTNLKARLRSTGIRVDNQTRREKVHEEITSSGDRASSAQANDNSRRRSKGGRRPWRRRRGPKDGGENKRQSSSGTQNAGGKADNPSS